MKIYDYIKIISYLKGIIEGTEFEGHLFSVGGCERDKRISPNKIKDIDLVVDIPDGGIKFAKWLSANNFLTGEPVVYEHYGTAMFRLKAFPNDELESVQTRKESYRDMESRNPETAFGTIMEDCMRRDFTINSLYHNISTDEDLDMTGMGLKDLENGVIRSCDDPDIIFFEDPLRIMRAIRFSSRYHFEIEQGTYEGIKKHAPRLSIISMERINDEFTKIVTMNHMQLTAFALLVDTGIIDAVFGNILKVKIDTDNVLKALDRRMKSFVDNDDRNRLLAFLYVLTCNSNGFIEYILKSLKYPNDIVRDVEKLLEAWYQISMDYGFLKGITKPKSVRRAQYVCGNKLWGAFLSTVAYYTKIDEKGLPDGGKPMMDYHLPVNGSTVMEICNIAEGRQVKWKLEELLDLAMVNPDITREECIDYLKGKRTLLDKIKKIFK